jgi:hypothetical protein
MQAVASVSSRAVDTNLPTNTRVVHGAIVGELYQIVVGSGLLFTSIRLSVRLSVCLSVCPT